MFVDALKAYEDDMNSVNKYADELYAKQFAVHFDVITKLYTRMQSEIHPMTDEELESVLTELPLHLFTASEALNKLRSNCEVIKLKNKRTKEELIHEAERMIDEEQTRLSNTENGRKITLTERNAYINSYVTEHMAEYEILVTVYSSLITRVENQMSFAKELIMGSKKIWDSRKTSIDANPVSETEGHDELPDYVVPAPNTIPNKTYITG